MYVILASLFIYLCLEVEGEAPLEPSTTHVHGADSTVYSISVVGDLYCQSVSHPIHILESGFLPNHLQIDGFIRS